MIANIVISVKHGRRHGTAHIVSGNCLGGSKIRNDLVIVRATSSAPNATGTAALGNGRIRHHSPTTRLRNTIGGTTASGTQHHLGANPW